MSDTKRSPFIAIMIFSLSVSVGFVGFFAVAPSHIEFFSALLGVIFSLVISAGIGLLAAALWLDVAPMELVHT